ncbi:hypothetical protein JZ751_007734 [Albula glossodonta]|uniref:Uncharacterized protein n=1 Tax=Albula glossodonta TaxID=121402 RepID=A0A8T2P2F5_9TELE|nr:hypothetical protein JZ751_007734 [Albula glossodonta]
MIKNRTFGPFTPFIPGWRAPTGNEGLQQSYLTGPHEGNACKSDGGGVEGVEGVEIAARLKRLRGFEQDSRERGIKRGEHADLLMFIPAEQEMERGQTLRPTTDHTGWTQEAGHTACSFLFH